MTIETLHWTTQIDYPILTLLQLLPLVSVVLLWFLRRHRWLVPAGMAAALLELLLSIDLWRHYDTSLAGFQFTEKVELLPQLTYHAGVDGISVIFILLTALLTLLIA
ncbi:MAG: oxidoreductase, partial [Candidatus Thiodiazotropha sp.]